MSRSVKSAGRRLSVWLDPAVLKALEHCKADEDRPKSRIVEDALRDYLKADRTGCAEEVAVAS